MILLGYPYNTLLFYATPTEQESNVVPLTLMARTRQLLHASDKSVLTLYTELRDKGSDISYYWIRNFSSGRNIDPGVNNVEELYTHLTGKPVLTETV